MKGHIFSVEELMLDDSFVSWCLNDDLKISSHWPTIIRDNPEQEEIFTEATKLVKLLHGGLTPSEVNRQIEKVRLQLLERINFTENEDLYQEYDTALSPNFFVTGSGRIKKNAFRLVATSVAAACLVFVLTWVFFLRPQTSTDTLSKNINQMTIFQSQPGERRNITLPDGSMVILNAESKIKLNQHFGQGSREIYLEGEAFFDVKHNKNLPFVVHISGMDIKALGTAFNVKAYPGEKNVETALVRGLIEVTLNKVAGKKILLHPNEKIQWKLATPVADRDKPDTRPGGSIDLQDNLVKKLTKTDDGEISEIAWTENKLLFTDETFADIAVLLQRWYGVKIEFEDDNLRNYRFTGIFEKEDIETVLSFLKESKNFHYKNIAGNPLTIKLFK